MDSKALKYKLKKYVADFFLPNRCPVCRNFIKWDRLICNNCEKELPVITDDLCDVCGKKICADHLTLKFDNVFSLFYYGGNCVNAVYNLKLDGATNFAEYCGEKLSKILQEKELAKKIDLITAVPMYRVKKGKRGYNQAEIIAVYMGKYLGKPVDFHLLKHRRTAVEQHKLNAEERQKNALESYCINRRHSEIAHKTVLLCDDVYTTGATLNACTDLLKNLGAEKVICVTIAVTE